MITKFRLFETRSLSESIEEFHIGDYIILDINIAKGYYGTESEYYFSNNVGEVIGFDTDNKLIVRYISDIDIPDRHLYGMLFRKATEKEVEEYKIKKNINKFNI